MAQRKRKKYPKRGQPKRAEKARFLYLHPETNRGKLEELNRLQTEYTKYLRICVDRLLTRHVFKLKMEDKQRFFPQCPRLGSQIVKNVRQHAISIVNGWSASKYATNLRAHISQQFRDGLITECQRYALYTIGKHSVGKPNKPSKHGKLVISQELIDLYWSWLLDPEISGRVPTVGTQCGMRLSEMTAVLGLSEEETRKKQRPAKTSKRFIEPVKPKGIKYETQATTKLTQWWLGFSHLEAGTARIQLPLSANPYIKQLKDASKGILARRLKDGQWRFEVVDQHEWETPCVDDLAKKMGCDSGLNVLVTGSNGRLYGQDFKSKFDALWWKIKSIRKNRQRQGFVEDSRRLNSLEKKLTGMTATCVGEIVNTLVRDYPNYVFVVEDLDLSGCSGQKRFAYQFFQHRLEPKAVLFRVNPAYTSQECPNCHYVSRLNRSGVKFKCRSCGKICHADWVGSHNILGRSDTKSITTEDDPSVVKAVLEARHAEWKSFHKALSVQGRLRKKDELNRSAGELTVKGSSVEDIRIASNSGVS